jgi:hypothetical protein
MSLCGLHHFAPLRETPLPPARGPDVACAFPRTAQIIITFTAANAKYSSDRWKAIRISRQGAKAAKPKGFPVAARFAALRGGPLRLPLR